MNTALVRAYLFVNLFHMRAAIKPD